MQIAMWVVQVLIDVGFFAMIFVWGTAHANNHKRLEHDVESLTAEMAEFFKALKGQTRLNKSVEEAITANAAIVHQTTNAIVAITEQMEMGK